MWGRLGMTLMLKRSTRGSRRSSSSSNSSGISPCLCSGSMLCGGKGKLTPLTMTMRGARNSWSQVLLVANMATRGKGGGGRHSAVIREPLQVYLPGDNPPPTPRHGKKKVKEIPIKPDDILPSEPDQYSPFNPANIFNDVMTEAQYTHQRRLIVLEGQRLVEEGFKAGLTLNRLFLQKTLKEVPARLQPYIERFNIPILYVSSAVIQNWSSLMTPPGIVGVFFKPRPEAIGKRTNLETGIPLTVICDNIREPGNLGSILRSAAGVGCKRVLLSKGCCDPWDPKVLRAGSGAQFYVPIIMNYPFQSLVNSMEIEDETSLKMERAARGGEAHGGDRRRSKSGDDVDGGRRSISGTGTDDDEDGAAVHVHDSDNVEEDSKKKNKMSPSSFALFLADSHNNSGSDNMETAEADERKSLPIVSYTDVDYSGFRNVYLVVGGETEGLSRDILQITASLQNIHPSLLRTTTARLRIPLHNNVESLNASHAFAIISYEILRQYRGKQAQLLKPTTATTTTTTTTTPTTTNNSL